jgi:hypothetical protein
MATVVTSSVGPDPIKVGDKWVAKKRSVLGTVTVTKIEHGPLIKNLSSGDEDWYNNKVKAGETEGEGFIISGSLSYQISIADLKRLSKDSDIQNLVEPDDHMVDAKGDVRFSELELRERFERVK